MILQRLAGKAPGASDENECENPATYQRASRSRATSSTPVPLVTKIGRVGVEHAPDGAKFSIKSESGNLLTSPGIDWWSAKLVDETICGMYN